MKIRKRTALWFLAGFLYLLGCAVFLFPAIRFSAYVLFGLGSVVVCYQLLSLLSGKKPRLAAVLRRLLTILLCILLFAAATTEIIILNASKGSQENDSNYLIVLGAGVNGTAPSLSLRERLDAAYAYLIAHPDTVCVVSGGQGNGEAITEAACMYDYLTARGLDPQRILLEDQATSTRENLVFSKAVITQYAGKAPAHVAILSAEYHLYRASLMAKDQGLEPVMVPAHTSWLSLRINYFLREIAGVWYYLLFGG